MIDWRPQLRNPQLRVYDSGVQSKHGGGYTPGRHGTVMTLSPIVAQEVLRSALYDPAEALGGKAPKLWGIHQETISQFMYDN